MNLYCDLEVGCESMRGLLHPARGVRVGIWEAVPCLSGKKGAAASKWTAEIARAALIALALQFQTMTAF